LARPWRGLEAPNKPARPMHTARARRAGRAAPIVGGGVGDVAEVAKLASRRKLQFRECSAEPAAETRWPNTAWRNPAGRLPASRDRCGPRISHRGRGPAPYRKRDAAVAPTSAARLELLMSERRDLVGQQRGEQHPFVMRVFAAPSPMTATGVSAKGRHARASLRPPSRTAASRSEMMTSGSLMRSLRAEYHETRLSRHPSTKRWPLVEELEHRGRGGILR